MDRLPMLPEAQRVVETVCDTCARPVVHISKGLWRLSPCRYGAHTAGYVLGRTFEEMIEKRNVELSKRSLRIRATDQRPFAQRLCRLGIRELFYGCGLGNWWHANTRRRYAIEAMLIVTVVALWIGH